MSVAARLIFAFALVLVACGDDESAAPSEANQGADIRGRADTRPDAAFDSADPDAPDVTDDTDADRSDLADVSDAGDTPPAVELACDDGDDNDDDGLVDCADPDCPGPCELCNDLIDNDGDEAIDCDDTDCSNDDACPEFCGNEVDDDADEAIDCDDSECSGAPRCVEPPVDVDDYEFSSQLGYFYRLQYPPDDAPCCFDYNRDDRPDNNLQVILDLIPGYDAQAGMNYQVNKGNVALMLEWVDMPASLEDGGAANFNLYRVDPVDPEKPFPLFSPQEPEDNVWNDGAGVFRVQRDSFDSRGPRVRFRNGSVESPHPTRENATGLFTTEPATMNLTIPVDEIGLDISVNLHGAQIEMDLTATSSEAGPDTITTVNDDSGRELLGGGRLGGFIRADDLLRFFNENAERCACARPSDEEPPLLEYGERGSATGSMEYQSECRWIPLSPDSPFYTCSDDPDEAVCEFLQEICLAVSAIPLVLDVDSNKNELEDSVSVGLYFDIVGAQLADPPVSEE